MRWSCRRATSNARQADSVLALGLLSLLPGLVSSAEIIDPGQGPVLLPTGIEAAGELSDIESVGGAGYRLISDNTSGGARVFSATIDIDPATGTIVGSPAIESSLPLSSGDDPEGLAIADAGGYYVTDEVGPALRLFDSAGGLVASAAIPSVFTTGVRANLGFEALARGPEGSLWTANEEALTSDGPTSSFVEGTIVRIQRFDADLSPSGQWGYITDPIPGDILGTGSGRDIELSGVVELAVLPDGTLLALERAFGGNPTGAFLPMFRNRIYEIDRHGATETSEVDGLSVGSFVPVAKTLLWEGLFFFGSSGLPNYEGLAVGPGLNDGDLSLMLVSDDNGGSSEQSVYPLRLTQAAAGVDGTRSPEGESRLRVRPNPVRNHATFVALGEDRDTLLEIYGPAGRLVKVLRPDGGGKAEWRTEGAAAGLYFVRTRGDGVNRGGKFLIQK